MKNTNFFEEAHHSESTSKDKNIEKNIKKKKKTIEKTDPTHDHTKHAEDLMELFDMIDSGDGPGAL